MAALQRELRKSLERTIVSAREAGEEAARVAIATFAIDEEKPFTRMTEEERRLRRALRAKSRQLGGDEALVAEIAYQHWHRMLFARFLAENGLLIYPGSAVGVSLEEVGELAREEGDQDPWLMAARFAAGMLPAIFPRKEPALEIRLAAEGSQKLEALLNSLPKEVFTADDSLGWVYQFWQSQKWKDINRAGVKIGAAELPAVTQLFTEDYMVRFLLENSLGAWWARRHPKSPLVARFKYLRFTEDGIPAAGNFEAWPGTTAEITLMDPCCGSGHFLTVAFEMLTAMRIEEQRTGASQAGDLVIRDNLFGLELDPRCTQIAAFSLALAAWKSGGYRELPLPNIACAGIRVKGQLAEWRELAAGDTRLQRALELLHNQFASAPELGSLIDPRRSTELEDLFSIDFESVAPLLARLLADKEDPEMEVAGWAAAGIAKAALLLGGHYTLVATNVPYLMTKKQAPTLRDLLVSSYSRSWYDLATVFLERCLASVRQGGTVALVTPQNWLTLKSYEELRKHLLKEETFSLLVRLGPHAFETIGGEVVKVILLVLRKGRPDPAGVFHILDCDSASSIDDKVIELMRGSFIPLRQMQQIENPDARIVAATPTTNRLLGDFAECWAGIQTGDFARFGRCHWELPLPLRGWEFELSTVQSTAPFGGREHALLWESGRGQLEAFARENRDRLHDSHKRGVAAWGRRGVAVSQMGNLPVTLYLGELFDNNTAVIIPNNPKHLPAIWAFCSSPEFRKEVRTIDQQMKVTNATLLKVPFDIDHWQQVADSTGSLPEARSNDPTQWLFSGDLMAATEPLQVAVARIVGYRWPNQPPDALDKLADADRVVCFPAVAGEAPAADRLRAYLERAGGERFSLRLVQDLLEKAGAAGRDLQTWLRDDFFGAHARLFQNRPFIWHIWDGRRDGFSAFVNYHWLDQQLLKRITYTLLGAWIELTTDQARREVPGAETRLAAAQDLQRKLELIALGEPPYDIYARWKPIAEQPIGWNPDLNDGVRVNIRPFVEADVLRSKFTINWSKDRGSGPDGLERLNNLHFTRAQKEAARRDAGRRPA